MHCMAEHAWHGGILTMVPKFCPVREYQGSSLHLCDHQAASEYVSAISLVSLVPLQHLFCWCVNKISWSYGEQVHPRNHHHVPPFSNSTLTSTYSLCCIGISGTEHPDGTWVISKGMKCVSKDVERLGASSWWCGWYWATRFDLALLPPMSCSNFTCWKFVCLECIAGPFLELVNLSCKFL